MISSPEITQQKFIGDEWIMNRNELRLENVITGQKINVEVFMDFERFKPPQFHCNAPHHHVFGRWAVLDTRPDDHAIYCPCSLLTLSDSSPKP